MFKKILVSGLMALSIFMMGCSDDAQVVNNNLIKSADNFEINRRIVFYNGITGEYVLTIEGLCSMSLGGSGKAFNVICRTGSSEYKRHTLVLSDNVTAFVEQIDSSKASKYRYRVTFKPSVIVPSVNLQ